LKTERGFRIDGKIEGTIEIGCGDRDR